MAFENGISNLLIFVYFMFIRHRATHTHTQLAIIMAEDEQFSLCWNNFNSNLSAGFHESLCRGDLVDVTLCAEGQMVRAHRLVLSVCSPYFRKMFTQMPANQQAFVVLKDVSHTALKDLIQFMYCGEVNVKQDALPTFISTAESLQIKGLTETVSDNVCNPIRCANVLLSLVWLVLINSWYLFSYSLAQGESSGNVTSNTPNTSTSAAQTPAASASAASAAQPAPMKVPTSVPSASATNTTSHSHIASAATSPTRHHHQQQRSSQRHTAATRHPAGAAAYKLDSEDSSDDKVLGATQKRTMQQRSSLSHQQQQLQAAKRQRGNIVDPLHDVSSVAIDPTTTVVHVQQPQQQPQIVQVQMQPQQQQQQQQHHHQHQIVTIATDDKASSHLGEADYIDLPIDITGAGTAVTIATKTEPEYEDLGDVETIEQDADHEMGDEPEEEHDVEQQQQQELGDDEEEHEEEEEGVGEEVEEDATYVEDEQYGDMKYDESYFTENDETKTGVGGSGGASGFDDSYADAAAAEASGNEAQG